MAHTENYGGFYVMTKFDDIAAVLHNAQTFSSWPADTPPTPGHTRALIPLEVDAPEHRRYRTIVATGSGWVRTVTSPPPTMKSP
ncbi:hypothetical protein [Mycobacterium timonense]|uniref:Cytochrome P450 n=1 Tax=Mycobacterium timonense TaxID=701043 RepID=A0ABX3TCE1_9MYCO|nr:hypothetical protein [Mycobacterium timonense]ORB76461.1 hypothetical protein BST46_29990 [Mycobacterium timonense]